MNLDSFKVFCLVVENGSISEAARRSFVSQPAVTRQIRSLEEYYGAPFFERLGGKLQVTAAGQIFYPYARAILEDNERAKEALSEWIGKYQPHVCMGATLTIGEYLLPRLFGDFKKVYPDFDLSLKIGNTQEILEGLKDHSIDIALVEGKIEEDSLIVEEFAEDELILICSAAHPWAIREEISVEELCDERMIWREVGSGTRVIIENALDQFGILDKVTPFMEIASTQAIKAAVEAGLGVSFLSKMTLMRELEQNYVKEVKVKGFGLKRILWMVLAPQRFRRQGVDKLIDFFRDKMKP